MIISNRLLYNFKYPDEIFDSDWKMYKKYNWCSRATADILSHPTSSKKASESILSPIWRYEHGG